MNLAKKIACLLMLCAFFGLLAACVPKMSAFVLNGVGQPVAFSVLYRDRPSLSGNLPDTTSLGLRESFEAVEAIEYQYDGHVCRLESEALSQAEIKFGAERIKLTDCREMLVP